MTEDQKLSSEYWNAAEVFNDDIRALAVFIGGVLKKSERKHDVEYVLRELDEGRLSKFVHVFPLVYGLTQDQIDKLKSIANCRFGTLLGELEEIEILSRSSDEMSKRLAQQEVANINKAIVCLERIRDNLRLTAMSSTVRVQKRLF